MRKRDDSNAEALAVSVEDAARSLGVGRTTIYELINQGEIKPVRIGRRTIIPKSELQRLIDRRMGQGVAA